ncbi:tRNA(Ile)-lysidine synthase [Crenobacter luteus]|uniref:tRNA lysidine(34) synthetase TilS n=1 Tax=Crenobacter luteus TaxID=1452487 RepID=UPI00104947DE|nr:tRNA lysidine(34) synthetase TilS [Crenobacter luteus]TCP12430.1 tRNA(Ile)-lysidine synthase [Crenobacter luteus]
MAASRKTPPDLVECLTQTWPDRVSGHSVLALGLSGGLDSVVLLHLMRRWRDAGGPAFSALHVHHGLSAYADDWADFCAALCADWDVPFAVARVEVGRAGGESLEAAARQARYRAYAAGSADVIALAHHLDDQAETVLLQLLRGGGPHALAAMPVWRREGGLALWRPLLGVARGQLRAYAEAHRLGWVDDDSNADPRWRRNWLRLVWLPELARSQPDYRQALARAASNMADAAAMLDELAEQDTAACVRDGRVELAALAALSAPRQRQLLLRWAQAQGLGESSPAALEEFRAQLWSAAPDRNPGWRLSRGQAQRYRGEVWPLPLRMAVAPDAETVCFAPGAELVLPAWCGALSWQRRPGGLPLLEGQPLLLCRRRGGERLRQAVGAKPVKTLLQEAGVPPAWRESWPLIHDAAGRLLALPSVAVDSESARAEEGWWPVWRLRTGAVEEK